MICILIFETSKFQQKFRFEWMFIKYCTCWKTMKPENILRFSLQFTPWTRGGTEWRPTAAPRTGCLGGWAVSAPGAPEVQRGSRQGAGWTESILSAKPNWIESTERQNQSSLLNQMESNRINRTFESYLVALGREGTHRHWEEQGRAAAWRKEATGESREARWEQEQGGAMGTGLGPGKWNGDWIVFWLTSRGCAAVRFTRELPTIRSQAHG
jgi:hypothetical protein